jgi:general nucleoside transport system ATP-binding protein
MITPHLEVRGLTKRFDAVVANDGVDLSIPRGSVHAIVGENGAGKTTLVRIVYGLEHPDSGEILIDGETVRLASPQAAIARGIGMVQQHFQLIPGLSALENLVLGAEPRRAGMLDRGEARRRGKQLAEQLRARIDWDAPVGRLSVGARQRLEIMRLLYRDAQLLIFDEPTTVLTPGEVEDLFAVLRELAADGRTIVFISHKLGEVLAIAERVTVMRRGRAVATVNATETDAGQLAGLMVGDPGLALALEQPHARVATSSVGEPMLELEDCGLAGDGSRRVLDGVTLQVRAGEIVGIAGVEGNGQRELIDVALGFRSPDAGRVLLGGREATRLGVRQRRRMGLAYIPEDRNTEGLDRQGPITRSAIALRYDRAPIAQRGVINGAAARAYASDLIQRYDVVAAGPEAPVRSLSGGNAQRLVVGRELDEGRAVLVAAHPSRGVDVKGTAFIHEQLLGLRDRGAAVLLISEELTELVRLSDRIAVLYEGRIVGTFDRGAIDIHRLGRLMTGAEEAPPA